MTQPVTKLRRREAAATMVAQSFADHRSAPVNCHHVIVGGSGMQRAATVADALARIGKAAQNNGADMRVVHVGAPPPSAEDEFWRRAAVMIDADTPGAAERAESAIRDSDAAGRSPAGASPKDEVLVALERRKLDVIIVAAGLDLWNHAWRNAGTDWSVREVLQTEKRVTLIGTAETWPAETDAKYALYNGVTVHRIDDHR